MSPDGPIEERPKKPMCATRPMLDEGYRADMIRYLKERKLNYTIAVSNGWYPSRSAGDDWPRMVIPCAASNSHNRYWQARLITGDDRVAPRYQSPSASRGDAIVVVNPIDYKSIKGVCLVEGPLDALAVAEAGYLGIAWMGKLPPVEATLFALCVIPNGKPIYVVSDKDAVDAAITVWHRFPGAFLVDPYPYKDMAEMSLEERKDLLRR